MRWMMSLVLFGFALSIPTVAVGQIKPEKSDKKAAEKKAEEVKKKAHEDIQKWVKGTKRKEKGEVKLYDSMVQNKIPSDKALKMMKSIVDNDLNIKGLDHYMRRATKVGIRGTVLEKRMASEVKAQVEKKKKAQEKKTQKKSSGATGKKSR